MSEEKVHEEELVRGEEPYIEEIVEGETVLEETEAEETKIEEPVEQAVLTEEHIEPEVQEEKEEKTAGEIIRKEGKTAEEVVQEGIVEEIIYTEGEGMGEMEDQEYRAVEEDKKEPVCLEEEPKKRGFFRRNREEANFLRDKWILSRIRDEDLMEYLILEQKRNEQLQNARDIRERRIISAFKLTVSLAAGVAVVYLLKDNPTIFVNILYIGGILGGGWFWKNSKEK